MKHRKKSWNIEKKVKILEKKSSNIIRLTEEVFFESIGEFQKKTHVYKV